MRVEARVLDGEVDLATWAVVPPLTKQNPASRVPPTESRPNRAARESNVGGCQKNHVPIAMILDDGVAGAPSTSIAEAIVASRCSGIELDLGVIGCGSDSTASYKTLDARSHQWTPGVDTKGWIQPGSGVVPQAQVLLTNGYLVLSKMSQERQKQLEAWLPPLGDLKNTSAAARILSGLLRFPARTIEHNVQAVSNNDGKPKTRPFVPRASRHSEKTEENMEPQS